MFGAGGGSQDLGSASARVIIDLNQAQASVAQFQQIAQQINAALNQSMSGGGTSGQNNPFQQWVQQAQQAAQQVAQAFQQAYQQAGQAGQQQTQQQQQNYQRQAQAAQQAGQQQIQGIRDQVQLVQSLLAQARGQVAQQSNIFSQVSTTAPQSVDRSAVVQQITAAKQPILELQNQLQAIKTQLIQTFNDPAALNVLGQQLNDLSQEAQNLVNSGFQPLTASVIQFQDAAAQSTSGIQGYFNMIRSNLESLNETSLAANLQEIAFRLLPASMATSQATSNGMNTAELLQEMQLSFQAFTGSEQTAVDLMKELTQQAAEFGLPMTTVLTTIQNFLPAIREAGGNIQQVVDLAARLMTLNPGAGFQTAIEAITKGLGGTDRSLLSQFHIIPDQLAAAEKETGNFMSGLDQVLNLYGRTTELAQKFGDTTRASFTRLNDSVSTFLASSMKPFQDAIAGAADSAATLFDGLAQGQNIVSTLTGGFLLLTQAVTNSLMTISQLGLGLAALKVLLPEGFATNLFDGAIERLDMMLPVALLTAFESVASGIATVVKGAIAAGVQAAPIVVSVVAGGFVGTRIAAAAGVGGTNDPEEEANRLLQIMAAIPAGLAEALLTAGAIFENAINFVGGIIQNFGSVIDTVAGNIEMGIAQFLLDVATMIAQYFGKSAGQSLADAGHALGASGQTLVDQGAKGWQDISSLPILPTQAQQAQIQQQTNQLWLNAYNFLARLLDPSRVIPTGPPSGAPGGTGGTNAPDADTLEKVYSAAVQNMIAVTRTLEDRALSAVRAAQDFAIQQQRTLDDFNRQRAQSDADYQLQRSQSIEDFNRQQDQAVQEEQAQKAKQQADFDKSELRARQDHLIQMQRMAQDVDDAISARDFLTAQKDIEKENQAEQDYQIQDARRREDFAQQQAELDDNLKKQQQQRQDDFNRQLQRAAAAYQLQQQRQQENFNLQEQRAQQDRSLQLARQAEDYAIQDQRRQQDFQLQLVQMSNHANVMTTIWSQGLSSLQQMTKDFFVSLGISASQMSGILSGASGGGSFGTSDLGTGTDFNNAGTAFGTGQTNPFAYNYLPSSVPLIRSVRPPIHPAAYLGGSGAGGDSYTISTPIQVVNGAGLDEEQIARKVEIIVVPKIHDALQKQKKTQQPRRGRI